MWVIGLLLWLCGCAAGLQLTVVDVRALYATGERLSIYEQSQALAALGGLGNRDVPSIYVVSCDADLLWLEYLQQPGHWLSSYSVANKSVLEALLAHKHVFAGIVLYDGAEVASSALVASTAAGRESLLPISKRSNLSSPTLYDELVSKRNWSVLLNLCGRFTGNVTGSKKNDAYRWAIDRYLQSTGAATTTFGYYIDYFWALSPSLGISITQNLALNHDYVIAKRGFLFDLDPWPDAAPNDDPTQPPGTDYQTLVLMLSAANRNASRAMNRINGFPPWAFKYLTNNNGVQTEWQFARLISSYNGFMDADACCLGNMANAALLSLYKLKRSQYTQNPAPTVSSLQHQGYINAHNETCNNTLFAMFYLGDYDSSSWVYQALRSNFDDAARGQVKLGWAIDPGLSLRFPVVFDYMFDRLTHNDRIVAGDSGAGYLNPNYLIAPRPSGLPSAVGLWQSFNSQLYQKFDYTFTGFIINGNTSLSRAGEDMYCGFSSAGIVTQMMHGWTSPHFACNGTVPVFVEVDLPPNLDDAVDAVIMAQQHLPADAAFMVFRSILQPASYHLEIATALRSKSIHFVDPLELGLLATLNKMNGAGSCPQ